MYRCHGSWMTLRLILWKYCLVFNVATDPVEILNWLKSTFLYTFVWGQPVVILNALNALRLRYFKLKTKLVYYDPFQMIELYYGPILCLAIQHIFLWCIIIYQNSKSADIVHPTCHVNLFKSPIWKINRTRHPYHSTDMTCWVDHWWIQGKHQEFGVQILSFSWSFRQKIWELAPPSGKSWIHHCWPWINLDLDEFEWVWMNCHVLKWSLIISII